MEGRPVWLASISRRTPAGRIIGVDDWAPPVRDRARRALEEMLSGIGDESAQRLYRMNVTMCMHRRVTDEEEAALPLSFCDLPALDIAGGPVEILWENVSQRPSTRPCESPRHDVVLPGRPDLWFPGDCGECEPCGARALITSYAPVT